MSGTAPLRQPLAADLAGPARNAPPPVFPRWHPPDGFNLGVNVGEAAGQTIPHLHVHFIPRYRGDVDDPAGGVRFVVPARGNYRHPGFPSVSS